MSNKTKSDNVKRIRLEMVESMKRRKRVDDDSDLVQLVIERMANDDGDYVELDMVNHPPHYKDESGIECIEVTSKMQFCGGNCFKYLYRAGKKGSTVEDLKKAAWYADYAWKTGEIVSVEAMELIDLIAEHRSGNIADAMRFIYEDHWAMVEQRIEDEIARLESEAADD